MKQSIFANVRKSLYETRRITIFAEKITGGVPSNPRVLQGWIEAKIKDERRARDAVLTNLFALYPEAVAELEGLEGEALTAAIAQMAERLAETTHGTQFHRYPEDPRFPAIEGRQVKAMLKEAANVALSGVRLGGYENTTGKTVGQKLARSVIAETVFVADEWIKLYTHGDNGEPVPPRIETIVRPVHAEVRGVKQTSLKSSEVCRDVCATFDVLVLKPIMAQLEDSDLWAQLWAYAEEGGLGADRSQGSGRFAVVEELKL